VKRAKERELKHALWEIRRAIDAYKDASDRGTIAKPDGASGYPPTLDTLVSGVSALDGSGTMYWLRRIPTDPFADPANPRWGLRSYASAPDAPKPGADVYDVYSLSTATSISGEPYGRW
jgi:general secretion pathway protein G